MSDRPTDNEMIGARRIYDAKPKTHTEAWDIAVSMYPTADRAMLRRVVRLSQMLGAPSVPPVQPKVCGITVNKIRDGRVRFVPDNNNEKVINDPLSEAPEVSELP